MLVTSRSDRHIEHGRVHAYTVSGTSLVHSSSLSALSATKKAEAKKEQETLLSALNLVDSKNSKDAISSDSKDLFENTSSSSSSSSSTSISMFSVACDPVDSIDSIDSVNVSKDREAWKFAKECKETKEKEGGFNFLAFRKVFTTRELTSKKPAAAPRPLLRQKSYFLEEHVSYKDSSLKASDLTSLAKILQDKVGLVTFRNFLKSVLADENLQFWSDVVAFKETTSEQKLYEAQRIYVLYIHEKATYPLNVAASTKAFIETKIESPDFVVEDNLFEEAQNEAYDMLERDLFPRFRKSTYFYRLQEGLDENLINQMVKKKTGFLSIFHT